MISPSTLEEVYFDQCTNLYHAHSDLQLFLWLWKSFYSNEGISHSFLVSVGMNRVLKRIPRMGKLHPVHRITVPQYCCFSQDLMVVVTFQLVTLVYMVCSPYASSNRIHLLDVDLKILTLYCPLIFLVYAIMN